MSDAGNDGTGDDAPIRRALRISLAIFACALVLALVLFVVLDKPAPVHEVEERVARGPVTVADEAVPELPLTDITATSGVDFVHSNGAYGERMLPETMGGGVAFLDYDNDGHQDLLLVNSSDWPWRPVSDVQPVSKLYRGRGDGTFEDVSQSMDFAPTLFGMGVAAGDFDGDGWSDVFITAVGENRLLKNIDGRKFVDVTNVMDVAGDENAWSTSAAFLDYDRDGDLDLFVCNYVSWSREINESVDYRLTGLGPAYGPPTDFAGSHGYLYRNDGEVFTDVSAEAGIQVSNETTGVPVGKGLAVHPVDINSDGWLDLVIANDTVRNFLFVNQGNGRFVESAIALGLAFDNGGLATGAMGVDAAYYANDRRLGIVIGNFANEMSSFYVMGEGQSVFSDDAVVAGIGAQTRRALTFGLMFLDLDLDGRLDLLAANGHVEPEINKVQVSQQYEQPIQVFWNCGGRCSRQFQPVREPLGGAHFVGRGAAYADIDGDGDLDVVITQVGGPVVVLRNDQNSGNHWVHIDLRSESPNGQAIGATVSLTAAGIEQRRALMPSRSYLSQVALPIVFGLGSANVVEEVKVTWPSGEVQSWGQLAVDRVHVLEQTK